jgi:hypothetical protein
MKVKTSRRGVLFMSPAVLAAQAPAPADEAQKASAAKDANLAALKKVKLERATEPAFVFKP